MNDLEAMRQIISDLDLRSVSDEMLDCMSEASEKSATPSARSTSSVALLNGNTDTLLESEISAASSPSSEGSHALTPTSTGSSSYTLSIPRDLSPSPRNITQQRRAFSGQQPTPLASLHQLVQTMDVFQRGGGWGGGSGGLGRELGPLKELLHLARTELDTERRKATVQSRELSATHDAMTALEEERSALLRRLADSKAVYSDLLVSDALAFELMRRPSEELSIREHIIVGVHKTIRGVKEQLEATRKELEECQGKLLSASNAVENQKEENERSARLAKHQQDGLEAELAVLRVTLEDMVATVKRGEKTAMDGQEALSKHDELMKRCKAAESEVENQKELAKKQADSIAKFAASEKAAIAQVNNLTSKASIIALDKGYLENEYKVAKERAEKAERECQDLGAKVREFEYNRKESIESAINAQLEKIEVGTQRELSRFREASTKEIASIRMDATVSLEREVKTLKDTTQMAVNDADQLREELASLKHDHEQLLAARSAEMSATERALCTVDVYVSLQIMIAILQRAELSAKALELSSLGVAHEEKCKEHHEKMLEVDMLRNQQLTMRTAFIQLESDRSKESAMYETTLQSERAKIASYETLESELLDAALISASKDPLEKSEDQPAEIIGAEGSLKQLARHALEKERELHASSAENMKIKEELNQLCSRCIAAEELARVTTQPTSYIIDRLKETGEKVEALQIEREEERVAKEAQLQENEHLKDEIRKHRGLKENVLALKDLLGTLQLQQQRSQNYLNTPSQSSLLLPMPKAFFTYDDEIDSMVS